MVVKNENGYLKTITLSKLGGMTTTHIMADQGTLIMFDKGVTLIGLKKEPHKLQKLLVDIAYKK